ncbi:MAG: hypothetical protein U0521_13610 [Anaerolineae bacterium]
MEADSRRWMVKCPNCGFRRSVWGHGRHPPEGNRQPALADGYFNCTGEMGWRTV